MSIEKIAFDHDAGASLYLAAFNSAGQVFDFDSDSWVALTLPPVAPFVSVTEQTGTAGNGYSSFWANQTGLPGAAPRGIDLGVLNPTATPMAMRLKWFEQAGGSPDLASDDVIGIVPVTIVSGHNVNATFVECLFTPIYRAGEDTLFFTVQLRQNGMVITPAAGATCAITVRQVNPATGSNLWTIGPTVVDANGLFTLSKLNPSLNDDTSIYRALIVIVNDGVTYNFEQHFPDYV